MDGGLGWLDRFAFLLFPSNKIELTKCYLVWMLGYVSINVAWDHFSKLTDFHVFRLAEKVNVLFNAATLVSSVLVITSLFDEPTGKVMGETGLSFVLAGLSGILVSIPGICPYPQNGKPRFGRR